jgi:hypothetical protein
MRCCEDDDLLRIRINPTSMANRKTVFKILEANVEADLAYNRSCLEQK